MLWRNTGISKLLCLWVVGVATSLTTGAAFSAPAAAERYARAPMITQVAVSPSGRRMALLMLGADRFRKLAVMSLDPVGDASVLGGFDSADVTWVGWVNDERLVYASFEPGPEIHSGGANTYAVNFDGSESRQLISWRSKVQGVSSTLIQSRVLSYEWAVDSTVDDDSQDVIVRRRVFDAKGDLSEFQVSRLNTLTGERRSLGQEFPEGIKSWLFDDTGELRFLAAEQAGRNKVFWRPRKADTWQEVGDFDPLGKTAFRPRFVLPDGKVIVDAYGKRDTLGLYVFDPVTQHLDDEPLVGVKGFDLAPELEIDFRAHHLVGLHLTAAGDTSYWFDAALRKIQASIDAALPPGRHNRLMCGRCETTRFFVVSSSSDRQPGEFYLYD